MNAADSVTVGRLLHLLDEHTKPGQSSEAEARRLLGGLSRDDELAVARTDVETLRQVYRRRAARMGADPAVDRLARTFDSLSAPEVASVAASVEGRMVYLWLDAELHSIIGCFVGTDRRTDPA